MDTAQLHILPVFVATFAAFTIGGLWYSPLLFAKAWMRTNNFTEADLGKGSQVKILSIAFVLTLLMAFNLAAFLANPGTTTKFGAAAGFAAGFGWVALGFGVVALFERRSFKYVLINGGYMTVAFVVMGAIIGGWR